MDEVGRKAAKELTGFLKNNAIHGDATINVGPDTLTTATNLGDQAVKATGLVGSAISSITQCLSYVLPLQMFTKATVTFIDAGKEAYIAKQQRESNVEVTKLLCENGVEIAQQLGESFKSASETFKEGAEKLSHTTVDHNHYVEIGPNLAKTAGDIAKVGMVTLGGVLVAKHGIGAVRDIYKEREETARRKQSEADFLQDQTVLRQLRTPGYVSKLDILDKVEFHDKAITAILRLKNVPGSTADVYHDHFTREFGHKI